jgi:hypothetical protein
MTAYNSAHAAYMAEGRVDEYHRQKSERIAEAVDRIADYTADLYELELTENVRQALAYAALSGMQEGMPE